MIKKALIILTLLQLVISTSFAQVTYRPHVENQNNNCIIEKVELTSWETIVTILVPSSKNKKDYVCFSSFIFRGQYNLWKDWLEVDYWGKTLPNYEQLINLGMSNYELHKYVMQYNRKDIPTGFIHSLGDDELNVKYKIYNETETYYKFELHFSRLKIGVEKFFIIELDRPGGGWYWDGIKIKNPYPNIVNIGLNEKEINLFFYGTF